MQPFHLPTFLRSVGLQFFVDDGPSLSREQWLTMSPEDLVSILVLLAKHLPEAQRRIENGTRDDEMARRFSQFIDVTNYDTVKDKVQGQNADFALTVADADNAAGRRLRKLQLVKAVALYDKAYNTLPTQLEVFVDRVRMIHSKMVMRQLQDKVDDAADAADAALAEQGRASTKKRQLAVTVDKQQKLAIKFAKISGRKVLLPVVDQGTAGAVGGVGFIQAAAPLGEVAALGICPDPSKATGANSSSGSGFGVVNGLSNNGASLQLVDDEGDAILDDDDYDDQDVDDEYFLPSGSVA
jgi:hypothetical protein